MAYDFNLPPDSGFQRPHVYGPYKRGEGNTTHAHSIEDRGHLSIAFRGSFDVYAKLPDGTDVRGVMNPWVYIRPLVEHRFVAREDGSCFICLRGR